MATVKFLGGNGNFINDLSGSGIGWYSSAYGSSVSVGQYPDTTYITDSTGTSGNAIKINNVKYVAPSSGQLAGNDTRLLTNIPNYLSTLSIQVQNNTPVRLSNGKVYVYDRISTDHDPVGVLAQVAVNIHPATGTGVPGSGDSTWQNIHGSGAPLLFSNYPATISPGSGGTSVSGSATSDTVHSFFLNISPSPTSVGAKLFALSFSCEFI